MVTVAEPCELGNRVRSRTGRAEDTRRARVILLVAEGITWDEVCERAVQSRLGGAVGSWVSRRTVGRTVQQKPRSEAVSVHAERGSQDPQRRTQGADRWQHALEHSPLGG